MSDGPGTRPDRGFPKMPDPDNMLGMFTNPSSADRRQPRNGPPIQEWEAVPIGKNLVKGDAEDDEKRKSVSPSFYRGEDSTPPKSRVNSSITNEAGI